MEEQGNGTARADAGEAVIRRSSAETPRRS